MNSIDLDKDLMALRHSAAHLLAHAVSELYPDTILTIGPATEEGFFYDSLPKRNFKEEDLPKIEARMKEIADRNLPLTHEMMDKAQARELYKNNPFKLELINNIPDAQVGIARQGDFYDLCRGGHVSTTGLIKNVKLTAISGSYWRADRNGQKLQRISGIAFFTPEDLAEYERKKEEAAKYDHRRLGKQLDLFSFHDEAVGFPFFHPKGKIIFDLLVEYMRKKQTELKYTEISTPLLLSDDLWKQSGHYAFYKDNMYFCQVDDKMYALKPMNCPGCFLYYNERPRSYRDLPMRIAEFGHVFRHELSGVLHGLLRARSFTQNDAHIICTPDQMEEVILETFMLIMDVYKKFNFTDFKIALATRPEKAIGSDELWDKATKALENALKKSGVPYEIAEGDGAFYGPKIDPKIKDSMGREWAISTIQVDFFMPENFDIEYVASSGKKERPVAIHRAITGSIERFMGILLEHYKGNLPFWISPVQITLLTITDDQRPYAQKILEQLKSHGLRVEMDQTSDQISGKIKRAQEEKVPWMLVLGKKEVENNTITLRHNDGKQEFGLTLEQVLLKANELNK
jgi:threonyl-tRNA synthetase